MSRFRDKMIELRGEVNLLSSQINKMKDERDSYLTDKETISKAVSFLEDKITLIISNKKSFIENFVNESLQFLLGKENAPIFSIGKEEKPTTVYWSYKLKQGKVEGGIDTFGGGLMALISTLLRIVIHILTKRASFMILDESLNHLSANYHYKLSELFKVLSKRYNISIILITHQHNFIENADVNLEFDKINGELVLIKEESGGVGNERG